MTGGADMGGVDALSLLGDASWETKSRASWDCRPTLPKGLLGAEPAPSGSALSLFRELDLWGPPWPFRGTITCWVGATWPCTEAGRSPPRRRSALALRGGWGSARTGWCVKDCERFFRGWSSKNSMMKACWLRCSCPPCWDESAGGDGPRADLWAGTGSGPAERSCSGLWRTCVGAAGWTKMDGPSPVLWTAWGGGA